MESDWQMIAQLEDSIATVTATANGVAALEAATIIDEPTYLGLTQFTHPNLYLTCYVKQWSGKTVGEFNAFPVVKRAAVLLLLDAYERGLRQ